MSIGFTQQTQPGEGCGGSVGALAREIFGACMVMVMSLESVYRGTSPIRNCPPLGTLQKAYAYGFMVVLGGGGSFS